MAAWTFQSFFTNGEISCRRLCAFWRSVKIGSSLGRAVLLSLLLTAIFTSYARGAIATDAAVSKDNSAASATITSPTFSTSQANELLLAFVATDYLSGANTTVKSVTGGGLIWVLVQRTNGQSGSSEIWRAFAATPLSGVTVAATLSQSVISSMTVMSFAGVNTSGTNGSGAIGAVGSKSAASGAPTASLVTTVNNSWVVGVGNDFDNAVARTVGAGQTLLHQYLAPTGDTYWVQMQTSPIPVTGTTVSINDTAPTKDRFNLSICEILPVAASGPSWSISGSISPAASGSGATVTLSGASSASTVADANGNYSFTQLANGSYTVTPSKSGFTFSPVSQLVTVNGANVSAVFAAQPVVTGGVQLMQANENGNESSASSIATSFTVPNTAGDFLLVSGSIARPAGTLTISDTSGNTYTPVTTPVTDTNQNVTSYLWYVPSCKGGANTVTLTPATAGALEVHVSEWSGISSTYPVDVFASAAGAGTTASSRAVTTTADGELIYGYTFLMNTAAAGSGFTGITFVNGDLDEYEIQSTAGSVAATFTQTSGTWFARVATFRPNTATQGVISGTITPFTGGSGATVTLSGLESATTTADANGNFTFSGLPNGSYTITPSNGGYTFSPVSQAVNLNGTNQTAVNFTAQPIVSAWSISGSIIPAASGSGSTVTLSGAASGASVADANGNYTFAGVGNGLYTITPAKTGYTFNPVNQAVTVNGANQAGINFAAHGTGPTWSISGSISPASGGSGATVALTGAASANSIADTNGNYMFSGLANGSYSVTPTKSGYTFNPLNQAVAIASSDITGINFTAIAPANSISLDVNKSQDGAKASATIASPAFSTATASELLLAFVSTDYLSGANTTVTGVTGAGLTWTLVQRTNGQSGSAEIWRAFAASTASNVTVTASLSQSVISSITVMSFSGVSTAGTNGSGAIGAVGSKSASTGAPTASLVSTTNNSWVLGVGNDFDNAAARTVGTGQTLVHQDLTSTGDTYWVQMQTNPVPVAGTTVTINDTAPTKDRFNLSIVEVLPGSGGVNSTPPTVSMTSPAQGTLLSSLVTVSATASDTISVAGVQFLLDGASLGAEVLSSPYSITWDTTTVADGPHTLSARARDSVGLSTTSAPVAVTVNNSANASIVGSWSAAVKTPAVAVNLILLRNNRVLFYQDGATPTVWDYVASTFTNVPTSPDLFCSGHALMSDGRILVVGGYGGSATTIGIKNAEIFDPTSLTWTPVPDMQYRRWYPNATTLSDGRILVVAGWQTSANTNAGISEIYAPATNTWTSLTNANNPFETYPFMYVMPDGRVIHIGGSEYATDTDILDLTTTNWSVVDSNIVDGGSATMYLPGKFMKAGSAADSQNVGPSSNTTFVLDMTQPSPTWHQTASMAYPRSFLNLTMLPDGTVLATGGETDKNGGDISKAVYAAELWSPQTQTWTTMASMHTPREYHGTALLLPDGRVLESGMGADFGNVPNEESAEFYSPPYLFKGARPTISQAPSQIQYGSNFFVSTPDGATIASVVLIRSGAVTHFFDENERYVPLSFTQTSGGLTVTAPVDANLAPPGFYMLFILNTAGVPSIAPFVQLP
ncbi:galactose oxidase-like domain-containing protein [Tunturiibacter gelidoferens]|uniref:DUF1929 domain-containing protein n=1 Tax=Tunturiibacter gelidiferens TaxID=3069689 RepID=A0A9X0QID5_9BACT|nr:galactose oxidase-like domain-containing protein [Edaphobacter lichenicola]MBB5330926.1 hypothetical protein [Edaphobacter lichenicola]